MSAKNHLGLVLMAIAGFGSTVLAQSSPPAWNPANAYVTGDQVQVNHNVYRAIANAAASLNPTTDYAHWELAAVRYSLTLSIGAGQTFPTLESAWKYALNTTIGQSALLKLNIVTTGGSFSDSPSKPISLDHAFGSRIAIGGDNPTKIDFKFDRSGGFVLDTGHSLASLSGIGISSDGVPGFGLIASSKASLPSITNMIFSGTFDADVDATSGAVMVFTGPNQFNANISTLIQADGGTIYLPSKINLAGRGSSLYGIQAMNRAKVFLGSASNLDGFVLDAIVADSGSSISVDNCSFSGNGLDIVASHSSRVSAINSGALNSSVDSSSHVFTS